MHPDFSEFGVQIPRILLPNVNTDLHKWAVVACDQYTAEPEYWQAVTKIVGDAPSTLNIIYPEAWLDQGDARIEMINRQMAEYAQSVLTRAVDGFVLVERSVSIGKRLGLVAAVDLEKYDFSQGARSQIRPTEGTVVDRIPPRVRIREGAPLESPHVMLLADDDRDCLIRPLYEDRARLEELYDFELMMEGGRIRGWAVADPIHLDAVHSALKQLLQKNPELLFAVGDGNHSLATARQCWLNIKDKLTKEQQLIHPARYALVEIVNLYDAALDFEPIHRVLFGVDGKGMLYKLNQWCEDRGTKLHFGSVPEGAQRFDYVDNDGKLPIGISCPKDQLAVAIIQPFLDDWLMHHEDCSIDYIHGDSATIKLGAQPGNCGLLLQPMDKHGLFPAIRGGGVLPRKTFSMGHAEEKRYYLECRAIV